MRTQLVATVSWAASSPNGDEDEINEVEEQCDACEADTPIPKRKVVLLRAKTTCLERLLDHQPPNPERDACVTCKMRDVQHFTCAFQRCHQEWGDLMTCDHLDSRSQNTGMKGYQQALLCKDILEWTAGDLPSTIQGYPGHAMGHC